jgi:hypothetical protein
MGCIFAVADSMGCTFDAKDIISVGGGVRLLAAGNFHQQHILLFTVVLAKLPRQPAHKTEILTLHTANTRQLSLA